MDGKGAQQKDLKNLQCTPLSYQWALLAVDCRPEAP